jgi:L,D-transpeptidase ErfK/SrfK
MKPLILATLRAILVILPLAGTACVNQPPINSNSATSAITPSISPSPLLSPAPTEEVSSVPVTLPVLDAFFRSDEKFTSELKTKLGLTDQQLERLRVVAREETSKLREGEPGDHSGTTGAALESASRHLREIIGEEKTTQLLAFVRERWRDTDTGEANATESKTAPSRDDKSVPTVPNAIPTDTRVVVNTPAYRMDVFENGRLLKSYKIGIGYPEFPLPTGLRKARAIIFNPTWTPPDEPWVESPSSKVKVGEKVEAGSKLNPLGLLKIPIGSPSLIHGGKSLAKLGGFASHGCVGLTDALAQDFAKVLAQLAGTSLTNADIAAFKKDRSETKHVTLSQPVPVELRYETIVAEDGRLHIYRDVYERNTNTEENLRAVLEANGVKLEELTEEERMQALEAIQEMSRDARGKLDPSFSPRNTNSAAAPSPSPSKTSTRARTGRVTPNFKGKKEIVIEIAALKGKGYPAMTGRTTAAAKMKT